MRVLLCAHFCDPEDGSEPGVGWAFAAAAAENHEVWLLTHGRFEPNITKALAARPDLDLNPVYLPAAPLENRVGRFSYSWWQRRARQTVRDLHQRTPFDLTHHVTVSAAYTASALAELTMVPFVWGPVISVPAPPFGLWRYMGPSGVALELARSVVTAAGRARSGRAMALQAAVVVAADDDAGRRLGRLDAIVEPNAAVPATTSAPNVTFCSEVGDPARGRTAMFAGRLLYVKGLRIAIRALARNEASNWVFDIYGEGPEAPKLARMSRRLGVEDRVRFHGRVPRSMVLSALENADAFLMPSLHDGSSWAIAEALSVGCPVVCLELGGPKTLLRLVGQQAVSVDGDVEQKVADALAAITSRNEPTDRYSIDRLPMLVDSWYRAAVEPRR